MNWKLCMKLLTVVGIIALLLTGCGSSSSSSSSSSSTPTLIVGALHVGSIHDLGYNEAMHDGLEEMKQNVPGVKLLEEDQIPETADAERVYRVIAR